MRRKTTFHALCAETKAAPTKLDDLMMRAAKATQKAAGTIKMWAIGRQMPDRLSIQSLANEFEIDYETLEAGFIEKNNEWKANRIKKGLPII